MLNIPKDQAIKIGLLLIGFLVLSSLGFATYRRVGGIIHELVQLRDQIELIQMDTGDILQKLKEFPLTKGILEEKEIVKEPPEEKVLSLKDLDPNVSNWLTYKNEQYRIQFKYPKEIQIKDSLVKASESAMPIGGDFYSILLRPMGVFSIVNPKSDSRISEILRETKSGEECGRDKNNKKLFCTVRSINGVLWVEDFLYHPEGSNPVVRLYSVKNGYLYKYEFYPADVFHPGFMPEDFESGKVRSYLIELRQKGLPIYEKFIENLHIY